MTLDEAAALIRDSAGTIIGAVLAVRDAFKRRHRRGERAADDARAFAEEIVGTIREPS